MNIGIVFKMSTIDSIMRKKSDRHLNVLNHAIELQTLRAELGSVYILCSKKSVRQFKKKTKKFQEKLYLRSSSSEMDKNNMVQYMWTLPSLHYCLIN